MARFDTLVQALGGNIRSILERHDVDPAAALDPNYPLPCTAATAILEFCSHHLKDNEFGAHLADSQDVNAAYGCLATLAKSAPTLRQGIQSFVDYLPVFQAPNADLELVAARDTAEFRWRPHADFGEDRQATYHGLLLAIKFISTLLGRAFQPSYAALMIKGPGRNVDHLESKIGCKVRWKATANCFGIPRDLLDTKLATADFIVFHLLDEYLLRARTMNRPEMADKIEEYLRRAPTSGDWSLERCAEKLGVSTRLIQRVLSARGLTFSDFAEKHRIGNAKRALSGTNDTLDIIARGLGYSQQSSFGRAFKTATGMTPQSYRRRMTPPRCASE